MMRFLYKLLEFGDLADCVFSNFELPGYLKQTNDACESEQLLKLDLPL